MRSRTLLPLFLLSLATAVSGFAQSALPKILAEQLPRLGHRNWIVVADSAYPLQIAPGIETVVVETDTVDAVATVLRALDATRHVKPTILVDAELSRVPEADAPGINVYRDNLNKLLADRPVSRLPHEVIINRLDQAGKTFKVLLIKTPLTLPYTSVFFELECGYWNADAEKRLRTALAEKP